MSAYYNEIDPLKAEVLREAIKADAIAPGDVDERSIADVEPGDLVGYTQCHFFAGGGFWSLALRYAGWPDNRPVWTGSCPCPSFSAAGKGGGFDDPRHLWPHWDKLIDKRRPPTIFGEQADDAVGYGWVDLVQTDLEAAAYAFGKVVFGACSVGAPHIRQRLYFVADAEDGNRRRGERGAETGVGQNRERRRRPAGRGIVVRLGESEGTRLQIGQPSGRCDGGATSAPEGSRLERGGDTSELGDTHMPSAPRHGRDGGESETEGRVWSGSSYPGELVSMAESDRWGRDWRTHESGREADRGDASAGSSEGSVLRGFWRDAEWIPCRNPKVPGGIEWRPIEPGTFPLAHGSTARVGRLRMFGDGIVVTQAQTFIEAVMEVLA